MQRRPRRKGPQTWEGARGRVEGNIPLLDSAVPVAAAPAGECPRGQFATPIAALLVGVVVAFVVLIAGHKHITMMMQVLAR